MAHRIYTVVCEFRGGTYVSQVSADDLLGAIEVWSDYLASERSIPRVSTHLAKAVAAQIGDTAPNPLEGLTGVWCMTAVCGGDLMLANIIETAHEANFS